MTSSTWTWLGQTNDPTQSSNWQLTGGPGNSKSRPQSGDTAIFPGGTTVPPVILDSQLNSTTLDLLSNGTVSFSNDSSLASNAGIDQLSTIDASGTATVLSLAGGFTNSGIIEVTGTQAHLGIQIASDGTLAGILENPGTIIVGQGDTLSVNGGTLLDQGALVVDGGTATIASTFYGLGNYAIDDGGTLELNQTGTVGFTNLNFTGGGGLAKIDQPAAFAGAINGLSLGATIDLGPVNIATIVFDDQGDLIAIGNSGTVFDAAINGSGNPGTFTMSATGGIAGDLLITEGGTSDTMITVLGPSTWSWLNDASASGNTPSDWSLVSGPGNGFGFPQSGDTGIDPAGTIVLPDATFQNNTLVLGGTLNPAVLSFSGDNSVSLSNPTLDNNSSITSAVPGNSTAETSVINAAGVFINDGTINADGPAGSNFTIAISGTTLNGTYQPGIFVNYNAIDIAAGNTMTITVGGTSELLNPGVIQVDGGSLIVNVSSNALAGGYAPVIGTVVILGGGTVETNAGYASNVAGIIPTYAFGDTTAGNTLKIDNIGSFSGGIVGFAQNDTIDMGTSLAVGKVVYANNILYLENNGGTILASLLLSGNYQTGTFALSGGTAGSFGIGLGTDGDTILTTTADQESYLNSGGVWQTAGAWSNGVPGSLDPAFIGLGASSPFTLTTGNVPVSVGALQLTANSADLQITSNTTAGPFASRLYAGTLEVTSGNTLTVSQLNMSGGLVQVDPAAMLDATGHSGYSSLGNVNGTLSVNNGNTIALLVSGGMLLVNGGTIDAAPGQPGGNGGRIYVGYAGAGTPATMVVQSSGTNAAVVTDTYGIIASDPISYGALTLTGTVSWTDEIDPNDTTTRGYMLVGNNGLLGNTGTLNVPFSGAATLLVENGATLTEQSYGEIGATADSAGSVTVQSNGTWDILANYSGTSTPSSALIVGNAGDGGLSILDGGTVNVTGKGVLAGASAGAQGTIVVSGNAAVLSDAAGLIVGQSGSGDLQVLGGGTIALTGTSALSIASSGAGTGTVEVSGAGAQINDNAGINVGQFGTGDLQLLNGGSIALTGTSGINIGASAGAIGTLLVSGNGPGGSAPAILTLGTKGISAGVSGSGTLDVESGGTIQLNGTGGIGLGQSLAGSGLVIINGPSAVITEGTLSSGSGIAQGGTGSSGTLLVENGGLFQMNGTGALNVGASAGGVGLAIVGGAGALISEGSLGAGIGIGNGGSGAKGTLEINSGGTITLGGTGGVAIAAASGGTGLLLVNGPNAVLNEGTASNGMAVGQSGSGTLEIESGGLVTLQATGTTSGIGVGQNAGGSGLILVTGSNAALSMNTPNSSMVIGQSGHGTLTVQSGGTVTITGAGLSIASSTGGSGSVSVSGPRASILTLGTSGNINVGSNGSGVLNISNGGSVYSTAGVFIANNAGTSSGTVTVNAGTLTDAGQLTVGNSGSGLLTVQNAGLVQITGLNGVDVGGFSSTANGTLVVNGGTLTDSGIMSVGNSGTGTLIVENGGLLSSTATIIPGIGTSPAGVVSANGTGGALAIVSGGTWTLNGSLIVGNSGQGSLDINTSGLVNAGTNAVNIGGAGGGSGTVTVESGGTLDGGALTIANFFGTGTSQGLLDVGTGGHVILNGGTQGTDIGSSGFGATGTGSGTLMVNGGTLTDSAAFFQVGGTNVSGTVEVLAGGQLSTTGQPGFGGFSGPAADISASGTGAAAAVVSGGTWTLNGSLVVGDTGGSGSLDVNSNGLVSVSSNINVGNNAGAGGAVSVESGGTLTGQTLSIATAATGTATGTLTIGSAGTVQVTGIQEAGGGTIAVGGTGQPAVLSSSGFIDVGQLGTGAELVVNQGGTVVGSGTAGLSIGFNTGSSGTVAVNGGTLMADGLTVGGGGSGTLTIQGGLVSNTGSNSVDIGGFGGSGTAIVSGGTLLDTSGFFGLGNTNASGTLLVDGTGTLITGGTSAFADINAFGTGVAAAATVSGGTWVSNGQIIVGDTGSGSLDINSNGLLNAGTNTINIGNQNGAAGMVSVESGGTLLAGNVVLDNGIGLSASGSLSVAGGTVQIASLTDNVGGAITVGSGMLAVSGNATIGQSGTGAMLTVTGGNVSTGALTEGFNSGSSGTITVSGGTLTANGQVIVGSQGSGLLVVDTGGSLVAASGLQIDIGVGGSSTSSGTLVVNGGSVVDEGSLTVGNGGTASVTVEAGGTLSATGTNTASIGSTSGGTADVTVSGGVLSIANAPLFVGFSSDASLVVENAGTVLTSFNGVGPAVDINATGAGQAKVTVTGAGSVWDITAASSDQLAIGDNGTGTLTVSNGAVVNAGTAAIVLGNQSTGSGFVDVSGGGALLEGRSLTVGNGGPGSTLEIGSGGTVDASAATVGSGDTLLLAGGVLNASTLTVQNGGTITGYGTVNGTVTNFGTLVAAGGSLDIVDALHNNGGVTVVALSTLSAGGGIYDNGSLTNAGLIAQTVTLGGGASVTNLSGGTIVSATLNTAPIYASSGPATITNFGLIAGPSSAGIRLDGGSIINMSGGTISGGAGNGITGVGAVTVVNAGSIAGSSDAIKLAANYANRVVIDPGAAFSGTIDGGNTIGSSIASTLELASSASAGTLSGLGSRYIDFAQTTIDPGASWTLTNSSYLASAGTLTNLGTLTLGNSTLSGGGMLVDDGLITSSGGSVSLSGTAVIGQNATSAALTVSGGTFTAGTMILGGNAGSNGTLTVSGGTVSATTDLLLGENGNGLAVVNSGGVLNASGGLTVDDPSEGTEPPPSGNGNGTLVVNGGSVSVSTGFLIGNTGTALVTVEADGTFSATGAEFSIGNQPGGTTSVLVNHGVFLTTGGELQITGNASVLVGNAGTVVTTNTYGGTGVYIDGTGSLQPNVTVTGTGSVWDLNGAAARLVVGYTGDASLTVSNGAMVNAGANTVDIADKASATAIVQVSGGTLEGGNVVAGNAGTAEVSVNNGGLLQAAGSLSIDSSSNITLFNGTVSATSASSNAGLISGFGVVAAQLANSGAISAFSGGQTLEVTGNVTGSGFLDLESTSTLRLDGSLASSETIQFTGTGEALILNVPGTVLANVVESFGNADEFELDLAGATITSVNVVGGNTIDVVTNTGSYLLTDVSFAAGATEQFVWGTDAATGDQYFEMTQPTTIVWSGAVSTDYGTAGNWQGNSVPTALNPVSFSSNPGTITGSGSALAITVGGSGTWAFNGTTLSVAGEQQGFGTLGVDFSTSALLNGGSWNVGGATVIDQPNGGTVVADQGASLIIAGLTVGASESGDFAVNGGTVISTGAPFGIVVGASGTAADGTLSVANGTVVSNGELIVGNGGTGVVTVGNGGTLLTSGIYNVIGDLSGSSGSLTVDSGGTFAVTRASGTSIALEIGSLGSNVGEAAASGAILVTGSGALLSTNGSPLGLGGGFGSSGTLTVAQGGSVVVGTPNSRSAAALVVANGTLTTGTVTVTDPGSTLTSSGYALVGRGGSATLLVENSGRMVVNDDTNAVGGIGIGAGNGGTLQSIGGSGTATITSNGALIVNSNTSGITVGGFGVNGTLNVNDGGTVSTGAYLNVGDAALLSGTVYGGTGVLNVGTGGTVQVSAPAQANSYAVAIGTASSNVAGPTNTATGVATVSGTGALLMSNSGLSVGYAANGTLTVSMGGTVVASTLNSASLSALSVGKLGNGSVTITDAGSSIDTTGAVYVGRAGTGTLTVENHGSLVLSPDPTSNANLAIGGAGLTSGTVSGTVTNTLFMGGSGTALVTNDGLISTQGGVTIGENGAAGTLTVNNGGTVLAATHFEIGASISLAAGTTLISTAGTTVASSGTIIGSAGSVAIGPGGTVIADGAGLSGAPDIIVGVGTASSGTLTVGGAGALLSSNGGTIVVGSGGGGTLTVNSGAVVNAGTGAVDIGNQAGGTIAVNGGTLEGGTIVVGNGGSGTLSIGSAGMVTASVVNVGGLVALAGGTLDATSQITFASSPANAEIVGYGTMIAAQLLGGNYTASGGTLEATGAIVSSGTTGTIAISGGAAFQADATIASSETVQFITSGSPENLILGAAQATNAFAINNWQNGDAIVFSNGVTVTGEQWVSGTLDVFTSGGTYDFTNVTLAAGTTPVFSNTANSVALVSCFAAGTRIATPDGLKLVEDLAVGDTVCAVLTGKPRPIVWIGHRTIDCTRHPKPAQVWPVRIAAGAFGRGQPARTLHLSPDHAVYVDGVLIPVKYLINDETIVQEPCDSVTYYHLELPRHDVVLAEGLPAESYLDTGDRGNFANGGRPIVLYPDFSSRIWEAEGCAEIIIVGPKLDVVRARLARAARRKRAPGKRAA